MKKNILILLSFVSILFLSAATSRHDSVQLRSFTTGSVLFISSESITQDNSGLFFNSASNLLGVNTASPNEVGTFNGRISLAETTAPTLTSGFSKLYVKTDNDLYYMDESGTEINLTAGLESHEVPTVQKFTTGSGTYTTPTSPRTPLYIRVRMVGGGGGGSGSGTASGGNGGSGGNTTFGTTLLVANGGGGGQYNSSQGSGGSASLGSGPIGTAITGGKGGPGTSTGTTAVNLTGGSGASSPFGGEGAGGMYTSSGTAAVANTGSGGGGGGTGASAGATGPGGGAGGYVDAIITSPASSYSYAIGASGAAGSAGTSGSVGGAGGSGYIEVTEYYQ